MCIRSHRLLNNIALSGEIGGNDPPLLKSRYYTLLYNVQESQAHAHLPLLDRIILSLLRVRER